MSELLNTFKETEQSSLMLEQNRIDAVNSLSLYLETPEEKVLREHQVDVMLDLRDALQRGEKEGFIHLPTGSGKTVVATELARVLGKKTVFVSPTRLILGQTKDKAEQFSPELKISNYFSDEKNLSGQVINTTYNSLQRLIETGLLYPSEIELLIADELHTALGPSRHEVFKYFTNALLVGLDATPDFAKLDFYQRIGKVEQGERWTNMFRNKYHEMTKEEAIERGALSPIDIHNFRTLSTVGNVRINSSGNYSEEDKNRYLNREIRNVTAIGMLAGPDRIPQNIDLDKETLSIVTLLHKIIKGKRTVYFGYGVVHVEEMAEKLRKEGLTAAAVHGKIPGSQRDLIFQKHDTGEIQIILGVDLIRLGWDSPKTEVGLFYDPTQSPVILEQSLGRIMRPSVESGKNKAIAIQPIDTYLHRNQEPLLLPYLFDPYYVMRGTRSFSLKENRSYGQKEEKPKITFSGIEVKAMLENYSTNEILQNRFKSASLDEVEEYIQKILTLISSERHPDLSNDVEENKSDTHPLLDLLGIYERLVEEMPARVSQDFADKVIQAVASMDSNLALKGGNILVFCYMGSILSAIKDYMTDDRETNNDIVESAVLAVMEKALSLKQGLSVKLGLAQQVYNIAKNGAAEFVAKEKSMGRSLVTDSKKYLAIQQMIMDEGIGGGRELSHDEMKSMVAELHEKTGIDTSELREYIFRKSNRREMGKTGEAVDEDINNNPGAERQLLSEEISIQLMSLSSRMRRVLELRFAEEKTFRQVGRELGLTGSRISQLEIGALTKLRNPSNAWRLKPFLTDDTYRTRKKMPTPSYLDWKTKEGLGTVGAEIGLTNDKIEGSDQEVMERVRRSVKKGSDWGKWLNDHPLDETGNLHVQEINAYAAYLKSLSRK